MLSVLIVSWIQSDQQLKFTGTTPQMITITQWKDDEKGTIKAQINECKTNIMLSKKQSKNDFWNEEMWLKRWRKVCSAIIWCVCVLKHFFLSLIVAKFLSFDGEAMLVVSNTVFNHRDVKSTKIKANYCMKYECAMRLSLCINFVLWYFFVVTSFFTHTEQDCLCCLCWVGV